MGDLPGYNNTQSVVVEFGAGLSLDDKFFVEWYVRRRHAVAERRGPFFFHLPWVQTHGYIHATATR